MRIAWLAPGLAAGGGHLSRLLATERAFRRAEVPAELRVWAGDVPAWTARWIPNLQPESLDALKAEDLRLEGHPLLQALRAWSPDVLLVDLFWWPVQPLVEALDCPAWLLLRDVPRAWLRGPVSRPFNQDAWTRIVAIEPWRRQRPSQLVELPPMVTCTRDELLPPDALALHFGIPVDQPIVLLAQTGAPEERQQLKGLAEREAESLGGVVIPLSMRDDRALVPLSPWLAGAKRIVGGVGYNLIWECAHLGLEDRARLVPFARNNDDQAWRMTLGPEPARGANGADRLVELLSEALASPDRPT